MNYEEIFKKLSENPDARLMSSAACSEYEIADAQSEGNFYVDEKGLGFVMFIPRVNNKMETN